MRLGALIVGGALAIIIAMAILLTRLIKKQKGKRSEERNLKTSGKRNA
jgi:flagellar biogenesis protein FliO